MRNQNQFLIGLPSAGKTTYLAALWHLLESEEIEHSLKLLSIDGDKTYLNSIRKIWARCAPIDRTTLGETKLAKMTLKDEISNIQTVLTIPDLSGEIFSDHWWTNRTVDKELYDLISSSSGGILMINHENIVEATLIRDVENSVEDLKKNIESNGNLTESTKNDEYFEPWDPKKVPTQIILTEILQFITEILKHKFIRLAVVISAWDVLDEGISPNEFCRVRLPLVWQYLSSNPELFEVQYFGISAQGGSNAELDSLKVVTPPSKRSFIIDQDNLKSHNISLPIQWLLETSNYNAK